ncbi:hypothetical protein N7467_009407 [Penicillium canescens]|nr:hypothetical protein N7467_009407 [Penicillium canescens]
MNSVKKISEEVSPPAYEPTPSSTAIDDARALRNALSGFRRDKKALIRIIPVASSDSNRMALVQETYTRLFHRVLEEDIRGHSPLYSFFTSAILGMTKGQIWMDVEHLQQMYCGWPEALILQSFSEIIFYRPRAMLQAIEELYNQKHSKPLVDFVKLLCKGGAAQLFARCLETVRCEDGTDALDTQQIRVDVQQLHQGIRQQGENMSFSLDILARSSRERLIAIMDVFEEIYSVSLVDYIKQKVTDGFQMTLVYLLSWSEDPVQYARDVLAKLWHVKPRSLYMVSVLHTMIWAHGNRALFEAGKMRLRYTKSDLREHLKDALVGDSFEELVLKIHDGNY